VGWRGERKEGKREGGMGAVRVRDGTRDGA